MIKSRGLIFIAVALAVAFIAAKTISRYINKPSPNEVRLVVAAANIPAGDRLTSKNLKTVRRRKSDVPQGSFSSIRKVMGRVAASSIHEDEPIKERRLVPQGKFSDSYLTTRIEPGMRAVSMTIDQVSGIAGMLRSGDLVDVIATSNLPGKKDGKISRVILSRVKVLAVSYRQESGVKKKTPKRGTVTLLLNQEDTRILTASESAKLRLIALNPSDESDPNQEATIFSASLGPKKASELRDMLEKKDKALHGCIPAGMRAVTIRATDEDGICGFIQPGDRVDVLGARTFVNVNPKTKQNPGGEGIVTDYYLYSKITLQNVAVLAIEEDVSLAGEVRCGSNDKNPDGKKNERHNSSAVIPRPAKLVTLLVSPEDAEKLAVLSTNSSYKLIIRKKDDTEIVETKGEKDNEIFFKRKEQYYDIEVFGRRMFRDIKRFKRKKLEEGDSADREPWESGRDNEI